MEIEDIIHRMNRAAEPKDGESIESIAARIETVHALLAQAREFGRGAEMRAQILHNDLVIRMRVQLRAAIAAQGVEL